jgi:hypothetical protein
MLQLLLPTVLLAAPLALPSPTASSTHAVTDTARALEIQIYRLTLQGRDALASAQTLDLVVNREASVLKGYMIATRSSVSLESLSIVGEVLRATVPTDHGEAELLLEGTSGMLRGTFTVNGRTLIVSGERIL